jgi:phage anti-repressor protein
LLSEALKMQELIRIEQRDFGGERVNAVSARELYALLGLADKQFVRWAEQNITGNGAFIQGVDFMASNSVLPDGRAIVDYFVTVDLAKRLSMMARSVKGEEVRSYFIECERCLKEPVVPLTQGQMLVQMALAYEAQERRLLALEAQGETIKAIEAKQKAIEMSCRDFAVMAYANLIGVSVDLTTAAKLGKRCAAVSRERNMPIGKVRDPRFGQVNTYIEDILQEVFTEFADL